MTPNRLLGLPLSQVDLDHVLEHTEPLLDDLRRERILLTGGTGFFGKWLTETLLHANDRLNLRAELLIVTRSPQKFSQGAPYLTRSACVTLIEGDVRTFAFPPGQFRHVIHAAADSVVPPSTPDEEQYTTIVEGTRRVLRFAQQAGSQNFLFVSSGAVYGPQPPAVSHLNEDDPWSDTDSVYAKGKRAAEALCMDGSSKIARCFAFLGPHLPLREHFAAGNFIADVLEEKDIVVSGDGTPRRSYLYSADLAIWLWTVLLRGTPGRPYNVGSEEDISIRSLAEKTVAVLDPSLRVQVAGAMQSNGRLPSRYVPSTQRARTELGLAPRIGLEDAICRTAAWYRGLR
jgi:nucleoside-diphosphate-sugar epimerase